VRERVEGGEERAREPLLRRVLMAVMTPADLREGERLADLAPACEQIGIPDDEARAAAVLAPVEADEDVARHVSSVGRGRSRRIGAATDGCYARPRTRQ
jgi:hypothetical protein